MKEAIGAVAEVTAEIEAEKSSRGYVGITIGSLIGGALGFTIGKLKTTNQDAQILIALTGMVIGVCASNFVVKQESEKDNESNDSPGVINKVLESSTGKIAAAKLDETKKKVFNKLSDSFAKSAESVLISTISNPVEALTATFMSFDFLASQIVNLAPNISISGATSSVLNSSVVTGLSASLGVSPIGIVVGTAVICAMAYVLYKQMKHNKDKEANIENKSIDAISENKENILDDKKLEKIEKEIEKKFSELDEVITGVLPNKKGLLDLNKVLIEGIKNKGEIKVSVVGGVIFGYELDIAKCDEKTLESVEKLGEELVDLIGDYKKLSKSADKGYAAQVLESRNAVVEELVGNENVNKKENRKKERVSGSATSLNK